MLMGNGGNAVGAGPLAGAGGRVWRGRSSDRGRDNGMSELVVDESSDPGELVIDPFV